MESAKSEPNLGFVKQPSMSDTEEDFEENKENFAPNNGFDEHNIK